MPDDIVTFYATNLRGSLFAGFMTLTGFLFTLHTFLLVTLHRDIYGRQDYQKWAVDVGRRIKPKLNPIKPLRNVSRVLFGMLCCSFVTSVSQLTIGLIAEPWAALTCVSLAGVSIVFFLGVLWMVRTVISDWLNFVEHEVNQRNAE